MFKIKSVDVQYGKNFFCAHLLQVGTNNKKIIINSCAHLGARGVIVKVTIVKFSRRLHRGFLYPGSANVNTLATPTREMSRNNTLSLGHSVKYRRRDVLPILKIKIL